MNRVFETERFKTNLRKLEKEEQDWIERIKEHLSNNLHIGKPLTYNWLREKKHKDKRLYFIINENTQMSLLVAFGSKKNQQQIIDKIIQNKEMYLRIIR